MKKLALIVDDEIVMIAEVENEEDAKKVFMHEDDRLDNGDFESNNVEIKEVKINYYDMWKSQSILREVEKNGR